MSEKFITTTRNDVIAEIHNLGAEIFLCKATEEKINTVTKLAKEFDCLDVLKAEFESCGTVLII